jgi:type II secretory pathway pseudopilin PulG
MRKRLRGLEAKRLRGQTLRSFIVRPLSPSAPQPLSLKSGFTLIELLIYVGLCSVLLFTISMFLSLLLQARIKNQAIAEVDGQGLYVMRMITQAARNADTVTSPLLGMASSTLVLRMSATSTSSTVFDSTSGTIRMSEGASPPIPLTNARVTVSGLSFQNAARLGTSGAIRVRFTLSSKNPGGQNEFKYQQVFVGSAALR